LLRLRGWRGRDGKQGNGRRLMTRTRTYLMYLLQVEMWRRDGGLGVHQHNARKNKENRLLRPCSSVRNPPLSFPHRRLRGYILRCPIARYPTLHIPLPTPDPTPAHHLHPSRHKPLSIPSPSPTTTVPAPSSSPQAVASSLS
jgi:hypothetical protein